MFEWENSGQGKSKCILKIFQHIQSDQTVVVVSQMENFKGWNNVTGFVALANAVMEKFQIPSEMLTWIEYFPPGSGYTEAFDLVLLQWEGNRFLSHQRRRILRDFAEELAGSPIKIS